MRAFCTRAWTAVFPQHQLAALFSAAFVVRVAYLALTGTLAHPQLWEYEDVARSLLANGTGIYVHQGAEYAAYSTSMLYPFLAAAVYALTGMSQSALILVQAAISSFSVVVLYAIGVRLVGASAALLGAGLAIVHPPALIYVGKLHPGGLDQLLTFGCLLTTYVLVGRVRTRAGLVLGLAFGMASLSRPTVLAFLPVAILWLAWRGSIPRAARQGLVAALVAVAVLLPWTVRNQVVLGEPVLVTSMSSENLWLGNNPWATGSALTREGETILSQADAPFQQSILGADEMGKYHLYASAAMSFITAHPLDFMGRTIQKFWYFWWFSPQAGFFYPASWLAAYRVLYAGLLALAGAGLWCTLRRSGGEARARMALLLLFLTAISASQSVFYVEARHRWMVEPLLLPYVAVGMLLVIRQLRRRLVRAASSDGRDAGRSPSRGS